MKEARSFIGFAGWYRDHIDHIAELSRPITKLFKKKDTPYVWGTEQQEAFRKIKEELLKGHYLIQPDFTKRFYIHSDASAHSIGAALCQDVEGRQLPVSFASRTLISTERNYAATEREGLALIFGLKKFRPIAYRNTRLKGGVVLGAENTRSGTCSISIDPRGD